MKIGITERGDAGIDFRWVENMYLVDGAILITKNLTGEFKSKVLMCEKPVIVHCTCTGWGGTELEPNVPDYQTQLDSLKDLIQRGFPANRCVLRIDPIFPSESGLNRVREVLQYFISLNTGITRIRISLVDEYKHVKERYKEHGWNPLYGNDFGPSEQQIQVTADILNQKTPFVYEICAENRLAKKLTCSEAIGCVSPKDLRIMGIHCSDTLDLDINPQGRSGCHCLSCKTELLTNRRQCSHQCVYCFWKN